MKFTVEQARLYKGYSQAKMSKALGISQSSYYLYETGKRIMRVDVAKHFSKLVEIPFNQIIFYPNTTKK